MQKIKKLGYFDLTNIIVGAIVGADIYIASALTAGVIGPFAIIVWIISGIFATVIALVFAYCSYYVPRVGGPFAYVSKAFDDFYGFLTGWCIWIAELLALPVFAITFTKYLQYFLTLNFTEEILIKALFLFSLTLINIVGVKVAGRFNDFLTILKLFPLFIVIIAGLFFFMFNPKILMGNYMPLLPLGLGNLGYSIVLVFWAYVGFELGTLPASEVINPRRTIPKSIITGMGIVIMFYLTTNFVVYGTINWQILSKTSAPLILVGSILLGSVGSFVMALGALVSVSGSDESNMLGTARLSYAMSIDGVFPKIFSKIHHKYKTPYIALLVQGILAFSLSIFSGISELISFSVFNLAFSFILTSLALLVLKKDKNKTFYGQTTLPILSIIICIYLLYFTSLYSKIIGAIVLLLGIPIYIFFSPKADMYNLKKVFISEESVLLRNLEKKEKFLANFLRLLNVIYYKLRSD